MTSSAVSDANRVTFAPGALEFASGAISPSVRSANRFDGDQRRSGRCRDHRRRCAAAAGREQSQFISALLCQRLTFR